MKHFIYGFLILVLLLALPLGGVWLAGKLVSPYLEFPPQTNLVQHAPFSWLIFILLALFVILSVSPFIFRIILSQPKKNDRQSPQTTHPMPWWGITGIALVFVSWVLAWNRYHWFRPLQAYTFLPLWIGYILSVNALTFRRTGRCPLLDQTSFYLTLFPLSAGFWWFFEYLNRFSQNWHYLGIETFSAGEYVLHATLSFSTVLPAVLATEQFLATFQTLTKPLLGFKALTVKKTKFFGWIALGLASLSLAGIGVWPDYLFSMLWIAPLLIITSLQAINDRKTIFSSLRNGDWRPILLPALAALVCGFFWEMWNVKSLAHWEYSVPFVQRFHIFEMPLLGYAGYLPFGLECLVVANFFRKV